MKTDIIATPINASILNPFAHQLVKVKWHLFIWRYMLWFCPISRNARYTTCKHIKFDLLYMLYINLCYAYSKSMSLILSNHYLLYCDLMINQVSSIYTFITLLCVKICRKKCEKRISFIYSYFYLLSLMFIFSYE